MKSLEEFVKNSTGETKEMLENLVHSLAKSIQQKHTLQKKVDAILHENRLLKKHLFGSSSEKINATEFLTQGDLPLFNEFELIAQEMPVEES